MSKHVLYIVLLSIFASSQSIAQYTSPTLSIPNKIVVTDTNIMHKHRVEKGQTIYSISKVYGVTIGDLLKVNKKSSTALSLGEIITIPLAASQIGTGVSKKGKSIPVVYRVQPKDNIYRLSKTFFNQPTEALRLRNQLASNSLSIGQELLIGWLQLDKNTEVIPVTKTDKTSISVTNATIDSLLLSKPRKRDYNILLIDENLYSEDMRLISKKEVAYWDKTLPNNGKVYALHNTAVFGSYIEVYNKLLKRSIRAKVIGKIPFGAYTDDVQLILSPQAAHHLGGLDERFRVQIKYYTKK